MAKRRANGEGNIRKRKDGRWEGRYTAGHDPETGKTIYKNVLGRTQAEVKQKLKAAIKESSTLDPAKAGQYTVGQWLDTWLEDYAKLSIRPSSHKTYRGFIENHIKPAVGNIPLEKLTSMDLQKLYKHLLESGRVDRIEARSRPKGLSVKTVRNINQMISSACNCAVEQRIIAMNPTKGCALPKLEKMEMKILPLDCLDTFFEEAKRSGVFELYYRDPYAWSATTLGYILKRPEYLGRKVLGKTVCENYKTKSTRKTAPEEQFVFEGAIPAIIDEETWRNVQRLRETKRRTPKRSNAPNRLTGLLYCADCGAKLTHHNSLVQGKYIDDAFTCSRYRAPMEDCTIHYVATQKLEAAILSAIQRISWYVRNNEQEFVQRVREASSLRQEEAVKDCRKQIVQAKKRYAELDGLVKKLYEANATGKLPDKHFSRLLSEYDEEQAALEVSMTEWQGLLDNWNADRVRMTEFIDLAKRYTDFSELTTPMLNEFIEKIVVHEGSGRGKQRRQRLDFYFNFIGAFEVPADVVTPMEQEEERRQQEEQAEKEKRSQVLAQVRYERYKQERREFTARKRAGLLTPEEQVEEERRLERDRAYQKKQRDKKKASQPEKPRKRSLKELAKLDGADLTPEEAERLEAHRRKKAAQHKAWRDRQKAAQPPKPQQRTLKELAECSEAGLPLTPEEAERLEAHRNRKKAALRDLKTRAETDPEAAAELAQQRAQQSEAVKKSRQKMYADAAAGDPEAQARYERFLATRRENYHRKKQAEAGTAQAS